MVPLVALGVSLLPALVESLSTPRAGRVAEAVTSIVKEVTGTEDAGQAREVLEADPGKVDQLRVRLAEIMAETQRDERAAHLEEMRILQADVAGARTQMLALSQAGSRMAWMPAIVTFILLGLFGICMYVILRGGIPSDNQRMADQMLGGLYTLVTAAVSYWIGTSRGAVEQRQTFQRLAAGGGGAVDPFSGPKGGR